MFRVFLFKLTYGSKFLKVNGSEFAKELEGIVLAFSATRGVNANLPHMSVTAILMIRNNGDLQHESAQRLHIAIFNGYLHPAIRLGQIYDLKLLQIIEVGAGAYRNSRWGIAFVQLVVGVYVNLADVGAFVELDVDQVRQLAI